MSRDRGCFRPPGAVAFLVLKYRQLVWGQGSETAMRSQVVVVVTPCGRPAERCVHNRLAPEANGPSEPHDANPSLLALDQSGRAEPGDPGSIGSDQEFVSSTPL